MMFRGKHYVFRAHIMKQFGPGVGIPLLNLSVKDGSKVIVVVAGAIVLAMVGLGRRPLESHAVQVPFRVRIVGNVVLGREVMLGMNQGRPAWDRVKAPVNEYPELGIGIPLRQGMLIERFEGRLVVRGRLRS